MTDNSHGLVCRFDFDGYKKGQTITDPAEVAKMKAERHNHFVMVPLPHGQFPDAPKPRLAPAHQRRKAPYRNAARPMRPAPVASRGRAR
jgi:hypothetical protein